MYSHVSKSKKNNPLSPQSLSVIQILTTEEINLFPGICKVCDRIGRTTEVGYLEY